MKVRRAAVKRINDEVVLIDIAKNDSLESEMRIAAVERINDDVVLADIAKNDEYKVETGHSTITGDSYGGFRSWSSFSYPIRAAAIKNIKKQSILQM